MDKIYIASSASHRCFLLEALYWIAFNIVPLSDFNKQKNIDKREDIEWNQNIYPNAIYRNEKFFTADITEKLGLLPCPIVEIYDKYYALLPSFNDLVNALYYHDHLPESQFKEFTQSELNRIFKKQSIAEDLIKKKIAWEHQMAHALQHSQSKLFQMLVEGKIRSYGRKIGTLEEKALQYTWQHKRWEELSYYHELIEIPSKFWHIEGINWNDSIAKSWYKGDYYIHILLDTKDLFANFLPTNSYKIEVEYINDNTLSISEITKARQGRPSLPWEAFHIEMTKLLLNNKLADKQEACVAHIISWFESELKVKVGRSTVIEKIAPYYKAFKKSENRF